MTSYIVIIFSSDSILLAQVTVWDGLAPASVRHPSVKPGRQVNYLGSYSANWVQSLCMGY